MKELALTISDAKKDLPICRDTIERTAAEMGFKGNDLGDVVAAVFEACVNAVTHGCNGPKGTVNLRIRTYDDRFEAVVKDSGNGFPCPDHLLMPSLVSPRGRGIPLMKELMDEVIFEDDKGCKVTLTKYLKQQ